MNIKEFKQDFENLAKKYKLPSSSELDQEFDIYYSYNNLEINFTLRMVRRRISEKITNYCNTIQGLIQPNPSSYVSLQETKFFNEKEVKEMIPLLNDTMAILRHSFLLETEASEEKDAVFIKETYDWWKKHKKEFVKIISRMKDSWEKEASKVYKEDKHYFG